MEGQEKRVTEGGREGGRERRREGERKEEILISDMIERKLREEKIEILKEG